MAWQIHDGMPTASSLIGKNSQGTADIGDVEIFNEHLCPSNSLLNCANQDKVLRRDLGVLIVVFCYSNIHKIYSFFLFAFAFGVIAGELGAI